MYHPGYASGSLREFAAAVALSLPLYVLLLGKRRISRCMRPESLAKMFEPGALALPPYSGAKMDGPVSLAPYLFEREVCEVE